MSALETVSLGASEVRIVPLGVGTWAWGEKNFWGYESDFTARDVVDAFTASVDAGLTLFDTAEVYGHGESEKILGWMARKSGAPLALASKFALLPGRDARWLSRALDASLRRLGVPRLDLYQIHWCDTQQATIESLMNALADAVGNGKVRAVGVSNFSADEMRRAFEALAKRGVPLASNQVHYSLLHRAPEVDGVRDACRELGVTLMAYSPLEQGILSGKYRPDETVPSGRRGEQAMFSRENLSAAQSVVATLREIGAAHGDKSSEQVALNWLLAQQGVVAIPGAKTGAQAVANAGALGWRLTDEEIAVIDAATVRWRTAAAA